MKTTRQRFAWALVAALGWTTKTNLTDELKTSFLDPLRSIGWR